MWMYVVITHTNVHVKVKDIIHLRCFLLHWNNTIILKDESACAKLARDFITKIHEFHSKCAHHFVTYSTPDQHGKCKHNLICLI